MFDDKKLNSRGSKQIQIWSLNCTRNFEDILNYQSTGNTSYCRNNYLKGITELLDKERKTAMTNVFYLRPPIELKREKESE